MRPTLLYAVILSLLATAYGGTRTVVSTTTVAAETAPNTSAAVSFTTQTNGNLGQANISKLPTASLLYPGATTPIYAHFMPWFGGSNHMNVGYTSNDTAQVKRQVDDMISRGIRGVIIDWYGPNFYREEQTTQFIKLEAEKRGGAFTFAITEDVGALNKCAATAGCNVTQQVINDLAYAYNNYLLSPAYMRLGGRPLVFFFGVDKYAIDWNRVRANVAGNPLFIFRNNGGFTHTQTDGGFSWVGLSSDPNNMGLGYLGSFYSSGLNYSALLSIGSGYPGFNDSLAAWAPNPPRVLSRQCGQVWLATMAEASKYFSGSNQLDALQLVTWNDYEEGTELESGIDNCVSVSAAVNGNLLGWSVTGNLNTINHFTLFISADGANLMPLANLPPTATSFDLASAGMAPGTYTLFVKAVGKPTLTNKMSDGVLWAAANLAPVAKLTLSPTSGTTPLAVSASTTGSSDPDGSIVSATIDFGDGFVANATSASHTYSAAGNYTVRATVADNKGATAATTASVTASAPAVARSVTITRPLNNTYTYSPVRVVATASTPYAFRVLQIYVDGVKVYETTAKTLDTYLKMSVGTRRLTVQALDSAGVVKRTVYVTVKASTLAPRSGGTTLE